jgi:hypothetical protein
MRQAAILNGKSEVHPVATADRLEVPDYAASEEGLIVFRLDRHHGHLDRELPARSCS